MDAASRPRSALILTNPTSRRQNAIAATAAKPSHTPGGSATRSRRSAQRKPHTQASGISIYLRSPSQRSARGPPKITPARSGIRRAPRTFFRRRPSRRTWPSSCEWAWRAIVRSPPDESVPGRTADFDGVAGRFRPVGGEDGQDSCVGYSSVFGCPGPRLGNRRCRPLPTFLLRRLWRVLAPRALITSFVLATV